MNHIIPSQLVYSSSCGLDDIHENHATQISGKITGFDAESKNGFEEFELGRFTVFYMDIEGASSSGIDCSALFDLHSSTIDYLDALFELHTDDFKEGIYAMCDHSLINRNLLILDRLEIYPEFRGRGIGLAALYRAIQQFGHGCDLVVLKAFPLQFENGIKSKEKKEWIKKMKMDSFDLNGEKATKKLQNYYRKLGFEDFGEPRFMIYFKTLKQPTLTELGYDF